VVSKEAKWPKYCYNKVGMDRLDWAKRERKQTDKVKSGDESQAKHTCPQRQSLDKNVCIFCKDGNGKLPEVRTLQLDTGLRSMATELKDTSLVAKIEGGDLITLEVKYYFSC